MTTEVNFPMVFTKNILLSFLLASILGLTATISSAAGKIENPTTEEVIYAIETTLKNAEKALAAANNGEDKEVILNHLRDTKQIAKEIEVTRLGPNKMKASSQMKKARFAVRRDEMEKAKKHLEAGVKHYRTLRKRFYAF